MSFENDLGKLNTAYFFREFTFSTNKFKPDKKTELELADNIVWLDDHLIVVQVKERYASFGASTIDEENWFNGEVLGKATTQIGNTLSYLKKYDSIGLENNQGHAFNLANAKDKCVHKLVIYHSDQSLPETCSLIKFHKGLSDVIHVIGSVDYLGVLRTLITPAELFEYLLFREAVIRNWGDLVSKVSEEALVGQFLRNLPVEQPSANFVTFLVALQQNSRDWDISQIIHLFPDRRTTASNSPTDYYRILKELAKLNRTDMRQFKERFALSMVKANADESVDPYRFVASTRCGFLFIPLTRSQEPEKLKILSALTKMNKFDLQLTKCIGLTFISEGRDSWCDVQWCSVEFPWAQNIELEELLKAHSPFRPIKKTIVERYGLKSIEP